MGPSCIRHYGKPKSAAEANLVSVLRQSLGLLCLPTMAGLYMPKYTYITPQWRLVILGNIMIYPDNAVNSHNASHSWKNQQQTALHSTVVGRSGMSFMISAYAILHVCHYRADSRFVPNQWVTALLCNDVSHWLGASLESALHYHAIWYFVLHPTTLHVVCKFI